jgi:uncharacterized protein (DUF885 family)
MIREICFWLVPVVCVFACTACLEDNPAGEKIVVSAAEDKKFEEVANDYVNELLKLKPEWATRLGDHSYDGELDDYSKEGIAKSRRMIENYLAELDKIKLDGLNKINNIDYRIFKHGLESGLFRIDELKEHEWNPLTYNVGAAINNLVSRDFGPLKDRMANAGKRLEKIPDVIKAAKANLKNPPKVHTETAIKQNAGVIALIKGDFTTFAEEAGMADELKPAVDKAVEDLQEYGKWLEEDLLPRSDGDFRIGVEKFAKKRQFSLQSNLTKEEVLKRAKLAEKRPDNETIVKNAQADVEETTKFVTDNNLVTVPDEPIEVIEMPEFARGTAVAYFDSAGPFEKKNETFYAIAPTPKDWKQGQRDSFYREYNDYMVKNLTVHEAMPGHYLQIMHSNKFKAPTMIRAIHRSGTFVEGWAVYSEQLMAEKGYGGPEFEMQQLKMKLRVIINAIIDQKIHADGMTEEEALDLMMNKGFQEKGEASGKWKRSQMSSSQLSTYYVGSIEVNDIRKAYLEVNKDKKHTEKIMHDAMLSHGSPAPRYIKELLGLATREGDE